MSAADGAAPSVESSAATAVAGAPPALQHTQQAHGTHGTDAAAGAREGDALSGGGAAEGPERQEAVEHGTRPGPYTPLTLPAKSEV